MSLEQLIAEAVRAAIREELPKALAANARPELVSIEDASKIAGVSVSTIRRQVRSREIPSSRVGRQIRINVKDLAPREADVVDLAARVRTR